MKLFILTNMVSFLLSVTLFSQNAQPEFYIHVRDNPGASYKIYASQYANTPIYDGNFAYTELYDEQYNAYYFDENDVRYPLPFSAVPSNYTANKGFDWVTDNYAGEGNRGILGCGLYKIEFLRADVSVFYFYLDTRVSSWPSSPDLFFKFDYNQGVKHFYIIKGENEIELQEGVQIDLWTELGLQRDWSDFTKIVTISNDFEGLVKQDISTQLQDASEGFPEIQYNIGYNFIPGSNAYLWKGATYTFSVTDQLQYFNGKNYKSRNWNYANKFGNTISTSITSNELKSFFYPTQPLIVTNNLEGGTSNDNFEITWQDVKPPEQFNFGNQYNAFQYSITGDKYTIKAKPIQNYNTNWSFLNWNTGSTYDTIRDIRVNVPITYTANYKGNLSSNQTDGFSSNGQRKIVRDNSGYYHCVYSSLGKVWYTKSITTNFTGTWTQDVDVFYAYTNAKSPSIEFKYEKTSCNKPINT